MTTPEQDKVDEILDAYGLHVYSFAPDYYSDGVSQLLSKEEARTQLDQEYLRRALEVLEDIDIAQAMEDNPTGRDFRALGDIMATGTIINRRNAELRTALTAAFTNDKGAK